MYFKKLKEQYEMRRNDNRLEVENRQRLNLSARAYEIIRNDMDIFEATDGEKKKDNPAAKDIPSSVINRIFASFRDTAQSSVALTLSREKQRLALLLDPMGGEKSKAVSLLLKDEKKRLTEACERRCAVKGCPCYFRMNVENIRYLADSEEEGWAEGIYYKDNVGLYVKAVLEEYAEKSYIERERIYCRDIVDEIHRAFADKCQLKIVLRSKRNANGREKNHRIYIKPYKFCADTENLYNYLVGLTATSMDGPWKIAAIRLSSMQSCTRLSASAFLSEATQREIDIQLHQHGVQYISSNEQSQNIMVRLTPEGEKMYRRMLHLRPQYQVKHDAGIYEFECTQWQIINYFFKFGHHVKILAPQKLADSFHKRYLMAATQYEQMG